MIKSILYLIEQAGVLMQMPRSHKRHLGNSFDSVSSHSHHASIIAYIISRMEGLTHQDGMKAVTTAVFHDLHEARTGDFGFVEKHYGQTDEMKAVNDQYNELAFSSDLKILQEEFINKQTAIAKCVKDADSLAQIFHEWVLMHQGNKLAERWFNSDFNDRVPALKTESARKIAHAMKEGTPQDWWWNEFIKDEAAADLEKLVGK